MCKVLRNDRNLEFVDKVETLIDIFVPSLASALKELEDRDGGAFKAGKIPEEIKRVLERKHLQDDGESAHENERRDDEVQQVANGP